MATVRLIRHATLQLDFGGYAKGVAVDWALDQELAHSLSDVLTRRTQLFYKDTNQGLDCAEAIAQRMAKQLGWDDARVASELASYREDVARSRAWQKSI